ncbi:methionyl-tRNA formyltransferase [Curvivirga sp.]|uniref:methionyl-tRNA formyltransferase n=1 Tax=Curvivirga sp. TaxID=2856848 RepID=UPI003B5C292C
MEKLRLAFMGTPDFAVETLNALLESNHDVVCVYTQPPRPAGRGQKERKSPVQVRAEEMGIEVRYPVSLKTEDAQQDFSSLNLDAAVVVAYGLILPKTVLDAPKFGCINVHASLLPRWRGAAPIQRAILAGDDETGVTIMQMDEGLDTGDMLSVEKLPITSTTFAQTLHDDLAALGGKMIVPALEALANNTANPIAQPEEGVTYAEKLQKSEGRLDWNLPATELVRKVHALTPWPGCFFECDGDRVKVLDAEVVEMVNTPGFVCCESLVVGCGRDGLRITKLQKPGKKPVTSEEFQRGNRIDCGKHLPY